MKTIKTLFLGIYKANKNQIKYALKSHKLLFVFQFLNAGVGGLATFFNAYTSKRIIDCIIIDKSLEKAILYVLLLLLYMLIRGFFQSLTEVYSRYAYGKIRIESNCCFANLLKNIRLSFYDNPENNNCFKRAEQYISSSSEQLIGYTFSVFSSIVAIISILELLSSFNSLIVVFLILMMIYKIVVDTKVSKMNYQFKKDRIGRDRHSHYFIDSIKNPHTQVDINIYGAFDLFKNKYIDISHKNIELQKKHETKANMIHMTTYIALVVQNLVLYGYSGSLLLKGEITVGDFTMFFTTISSLNMVLINVKNSINAFQPMALDAQNYLEFLEKTSSYRYIEEKPSDALYCIESFECVDFNNVSYIYDSKNVKALNNLNFSINRNEIVSIVGANGSGKSTLIKILLGIYLPSEGTVYINGHDIKKVDVSSFWKICGIVLQNINVFAFSLFENIAFKCNNTETDRKKAEEVVQQIGLKKRFDCEDGLNTELSRLFNTTGTELSGGEKQKIALCRCLYKNCQLMVLDEPSSALDANSEQELFDFIKHMRTTRESAIVFVSHRLSSSLLADKVIFLEDGIIKCIGPHERVYRECESYKKMYDNQANKYNNLERK